MKDFVHLHVHSEYSLLDGAARVSEIAQRAKDLGQSAIAITDHGNMYGVIAFYKECKKAGIKPIIGMEAYVAPRNLEEKQGKMDREYAHLVLLAKNMEGYRNLCILSSMGYTKGYYYRPRIDYKTLFEYKEGLIALSACLSGDLPRLLLDGRYEDARAHVQMMQKEFGPDYYIELQDHRIADERSIRADLIKLCGEFNVRPVCTNDTHYVYREDAEAQDALMCIQTNRFVDEQDRMRMDGSEFYIKSRDEMEALFPDCPQALDSTLEIAQKCEVEFEFGKIHLPNYDVPEGYTHEGYLRELCEKGMAKKCPNDPAYAKRLEYELGVILEMGYTDYFLIVWDFIDYALRRGITVGPGRGSAAGSLCAYCLNITDIDPIKYQLLFERFLNPERISMPDIDIDFCYERRQEVIDYVVQKYGADRVAQIITFGTMGAKQAIRDVGRVLRVPYGDVDKLAKSIPFELNITIDRALKISPQFEESYLSGGEAKKIIDLARRVEGLPRHASTHAAGVVICARPVVEYVPLQKNDDSVTTQFPMTTIEELGLLKMDFLGLRTLTVIRDSLNEVERLGGEAPDLDAIGDDDPAVYSMLSHGDTDGVFQLESGGMRAFLQQLKPSCFEDIIAGISLYRPGPMDQIPLYVERKFHPEKIKYSHDMLKPILNMTYGCMVYQEQVMQIVRDLAGYSLGHSDLVRRAMSKKKKDVMEREKSAFVEGCSKNGIPVAVSQDIFASMMDFAQYAFNKSHAAAYAVIAYRTAWLKAHFPHEFMAALINSYMSSGDRIAEYIHSCHKQGIDVLPPDINASTARFTVERNDAGKKCVRFGMGAVRNAGVGACERIVEEREQNGSFTDFYDFLSRCQEFLNKRLVEYLIKAGAFDCFKVNRSVLFQMHGTLMDALASQKSKIIDGQVSLFDLGAVEDSPKIEYPRLPEYPQMRKLLLEKEATGLYISGHPLGQFEHALSSFATCKGILDAGQHGELRDEQYVYIGGIVTSLKFKLTRRNEQMAYVTIEDVFSQLECVVFPSVLQKYREMLDEDSLVLIGGRINTREDGNTLLIEEAAALTEENIGRAMSNSRLDGSRRFSPAMAQSANPARENRLDRPPRPHQRRGNVAPGLYVRCEEQSIPEVAAIISRHDSGDTPVVFALNGSKHIEPGCSRCDGSAALINSLSALVGSENVKLVF